MKKGFEIHISFTPSVPNGTKFRLKTAWNVDWFWKIRDKCETKLHVVPPTQAFQIANKPVAQLWLICHIDTFKVLHEMKVNK